MSDSDEEKELRKRLEEENQKEEKRKEDIQKLFKDFKTEIEKRQVSSSENFDKSILTYSSWALGVSIAFLKDFIPITVANFSCLLYQSWILFAFSIAATTISFLLSYKGLELSLSYAEKYFLDENHDYLNKDNIYNKIVKKLNWASGVAFIFGLIFTLIFVMSNLEKSIMEKKSGFAQDGLPANLMTKIMPQGGDLTKGLNVPTMQQIPKPNTQPAPPQPNSPQPAQPK
ncbi:hypothetical protein H8K38_16190 [Undibacterium sp. FT79W]|uniref:hypothetical protein n=1 Tax=Undibacterium sp. FT79W TaxID=2762296 RepID=UPI00164A4D65|nr:hypothetical protein [Undibacterium sp. FT79W]MBC3879350.1 hypothetical protein [Undibacterium sp. FT79W]